ncbi:GIY-YIG nuclease family protein [Candidatus Obscuribacterales bacterium]|nr:GIY-YIG nuclease family protein [Candidatus Obscuribacterales bacterium]
MNSSSNVEKTRMELLTGVEERPATGLRGAKLSDHICLFLDCQTTGASVTSGGNLLEVAWCYGASGDLSSDVYSYLVKQPDEIPIPGRIQMLTGITDDDMVAGVEASEILDFLLQKSREISTPQLCIAHYARFETHFMTHLVEQHGDGADWPFLNVCTFEIARRLYPNLPSRGIRALGGYIGLDMEEVKRSNSHVAATRVIWQHLVERLAEVGVETLDQLQEFLATKAGARTGPPEYKLERLKRLDLPNCPGVYRMKNQSGRILYVGKATSLKSRVNSHFRGRKGKTSKSKELLTQVHSIDVTECGSPLEAALLETDEIKLYDPPYNVSLKQRNRKLVFASWDFLSFCEEQDEDHVIGPLPNLRALDALLRLNETINSGVIDPHLLFVEIPIEDLSEGVEIFVERHDISLEEGTTPRSLLALGLRFFRSTKRLMRQLAMQRALELMIEQQRKDAGLEDVEAPNSPEIEETALTEDDDDFDFDEDDLTPEEIATKLESLLISIARTYLASKDLTCLLNSNIRFNYKKSRREVSVRNGQIVDGSTAGSIKKNSSAAYGDIDDLCDEAVRDWAGLNVRDYDRMRVLLTEVTKMSQTQPDVEIEPRLRYLSRW